MSQLGAILAAKARVLRHAVVKHQAIVNRRTVRKRT